MNHEELARWLWAKGAGSDRLKVDALAAQLLEAFDITGRDPLASDPPTGTFEVDGRRYVIASTQAFADHTQVTTTSGHVFTLLPGERLSPDAPGTCEYCGQPAPADSVVCHDHWEGA